MSKQYALRPVPVNPKNNDRAGAIGAIGKVWTNGANLFNTLTNDEEKKLYVRDFLTSEPHRFNKILLDETNKLHQIRLAEDHPWQRRIERVLQTIENHACIGDVIVQGQSPPVAFGWALVRLSLRLATADLTISEDIASNLLDITGQLAGTEDRLKLFPFTKPLLRAASHLFAHALLYLVNAIFFLRAKFKPLRAVHAASGGSAKFKKMFENISRHTRSVNRECDTAVELRSRRVRQLQSIHQCLPIPKQSAVQIFSPLPDTGRWLLRSDEYRAWKSTGYSNVFLIEGAPGCGKSTLATHLPHIVDTEVTILYSCYHLSSIADFCLATIASLVRIVANLSEPTIWHNEVEEEVLGLISLAQKRSCVDSESLQKALGHIFTRTKPPKTTIILDALSECGDAQNLFTFLESISLSSRVRTIVLSRSNTKIRSVAKASRTIKMDSKVIPDVVAYVRQRICATQSLQAIEDRILQTVSKSCSGLFLLTVLLLDDLEDAHTLEDQLEILKAAPGNLFDRFEQRWLKDQNRLSKKQRVVRIEIFMLLVAACRTLTASEVSVFIAFDISTNTVCKERQLINPVRTIENLCRPMVSIDEERIEILHPAMRDFLLDRPLAGRDSNAYLAEKCLSVLTEPENGVVQLAAALLRKHLLPTGLLISKTDDGPLPYEYAALNWHIHLTKVSNPSKILLAKLGEFITGVAAVTWSERLIDIRKRQEASSINVQIDIRAALSEWIGRLPPSTQKQIPLEKFFVAAHVKLQRKLEENDEEDRLLPYLPAIRLGQFYSIAGKSDSDFQQAFEYKKFVVEGFTKSLGRRSPLTLQARTDFINEFFSQGLIAEAEVELIEVVSIEKEVLGPESDAFYKAMQLLGNAQYYLTKFADASQSLQESGEGLLRLTGEDSWNYQVNNLYLGWVYERIGDFVTALRLYQRVVDTWMPIRGKTNGLSIFALTSICSVNRKQQNYETARADLEFSWESRERLFSMNSNTTVDSGLQLALLYRETSQFKTALELLEKVEGSSVFETDFERACQAKHIRALIAFDQGHFSDPVRELAQIVYDTTGSMRDRNNRECMWIRITLADALRHIGKDAEALMFFSELVKPLENGPDCRPSTPTLNEEPETPGQLEIAEKALRMVRDRDPSGAVELLRSKGLQWKREKDFYIRQGGPPADTAWTTAVKFSGPTAALKK